jgi:hypothetical protein
VHVEAAPAFPGLAALDAADVDGFDADGGDAHEVAGVGAGDGGAAGEPAAVGASLPETGACPVGTNRAWACYQ